MMSPTVLYSTVDVTAYIPSGMVPVTFTYIPSNSGAVLASRMADANSTLIRVQASLTLPPLRDQVLRQLSPGIAFRLPRGDLGFTCLGRVLGVSTGRLYPTI